MLTSINVKFTFDSARLGLFSCANIIQIDDVALRVVFLPFFPRFWLLFRLGFRRFCFHNQSNSTSSPGLLG